MITKIKKRVVLACSACCLFTAIVGCSDSFLDRTPSDSFNIDNYYVSDAALDAASSPLYNVAWFKYNYRTAIYLGSVRANEAADNYNFKEFSQFQVTGLSQLLGAAWESLYAVVTMANSVIDAAENRCTSAVSQAAKTRNIAEARLMRGVAYFYMVRLWGPVILFEGNRKVVDNPLLPLNTEKDVLQFIINDLTFAAENLPATATSKGRATKWAAEGMLAKAYLARASWRSKAELAEAGYANGTRNAEDLALAKKYAEDVCKNSGLNLLPDYEDLFKYKHNNNEESLLAMQWVPLGEWGTQNANYADLTISDVKLNGGVNSWSALFATNEQLQQYEHADTLRRNATFLTPGSFYPYINIAGGGYTYKGSDARNKKGAIGGPNDDNEGKVESMNSPLNTYILRLADVYLTYAEACLGNDASLNSGDGLEYFNKVRDRAKVARKASITLDDIIKERRCEFGMEYVNWYEFTTWYKWQPRKMLRYMNNQERGTYYTNLSKNAQGDIVFVKEDGKEVKPDVVIEVTHNNVMLPYPESDVISNPMLRQEPQGYY